MTARFASVKRGAVALTLVSSLTAGAVVSTAPAALAAPSSSPGSVAFTGSSVPGGVNGGSSVPGSSNGGNNNAGSTAKGSQGSVAPAMKSSEGIEGFGIGTVLIGTALTVVLGIAIAQVLADMGVIDGRALPKLPTLPVLPAPAPAAPAAPVAPAQG